MNTKELIEQAIALPVEERALLVDSLLRSLNPPQSEFDTQWQAEEKRRLFVRILAVMSLHREPVYWKHRV